MKLTICCPACRSEDGLQFRTITSPKLNYTASDGDHTEHFGDVRDYTCRNCDFKFLLEEDEITEAERFLT